MVHEPAAFRLTRFWHRRCTCGLPWPCRDRYAAHATSDALPPPLPNARPAWDRPTLTLDNRPLMTPIGEWRTRRPH